jgi:hypothetical protein
MSRALVLAGGMPPYVDPWHPFGPTSQALAKLAADIGFEVEIATDVVSRLADLAGVDLLIANVPAPEPELDPGALACARAGLDEFLARPGGVLALHVSVTNLIGLDHWSDLIGARWVAGQTMHPPRGDWPVTSSGNSAIRNGIESFTLNDELYSHMQFAGEHETVVSHSLEGSDHPLVWLREVGPTRVVADALGHGSESYDSPEHTTILRRAMLWAADTKAPAGANNE